MTAMFSLLLRFLPRTMAGAAKTPAVAATREPVNWRRVSREEAVGRDGSSGMVHGLVSRGKSLVRNWCTTLLENTVRAGGSATDA